MKLSRPVLFFCIALSSLLLPSCNNQNKSGIATNGKEEFSDSAVSSIKIYKDTQGRKIIQKNNTFYDLIDFTDKQDLKKLLVKATKSETSYVDSGMSENRFIVSVTNIGDGKTNWTKELAGTDIDFTNKVLVVHTEGKTSDMEDSYTQYSLQTGQKLMSYTYSQLMALIPNTSNKRFFGYLSKQSSIDDKPEQFASISYVGSNEVIDKVNIKLKGANNFPNYTPEITMLAAQESGNTVANEGKTVILAHANRAYTNAEISGFAMQVTYNMPAGQAPVTILLPVREDRIDLANATYDKNVFEIVKAQ